MPRFVVTGSRIGLLEDEGAGVPVGFAVDADNLDKALDIAHSSMAYIGLDRHEYCIKVAPIDVPPFGW